jgi:hypothetical protein
MAPHWHGFKSPTSHFRHCVEQETIRPIADAIPCALINSVCTVWSTHAFDELVPYHISDGISTCQCANRLSTSDMRHIH